MPPLMQLPVHPGTQSVLVRRVSHGRNQHLGASHLPHRPPADRSGSLRANRAVNQPSASQLIRRKHSSRPVVLSFPAFCRRGRGRGLVWSLNAAPLEYPSNDMLKPGGGGSARGTDSPPSAAAVFALSLVALDPPFSRILVPSHPPRICWSFLSLSRALSPAAVLLPSPATRPTPNWTWRRCSRWQRVASRR